MDLPLTSSIDFLDLSGNRIDGPGEWTRARIEIGISLAAWMRGTLRLVRQGSEELPLYSKHIGGQLRILADWPLSGTGQYRLTLYDSKAKIDERLVTVRPGKISEVAYAQMLEDLEMRLPAAIALGLQRNGAFTGLKILPPGESTLAMELARLQRAIIGGPDLLGMAQVMNDLAHDPYQVLQTSKLWMPRERARRPHPADLVQAMSRPSNLDKHGIPTRLLDTRVEHSVDVYENRLVKAYLRLIDLRLRRLSSLVEIVSNKALAEEVQTLRAILNASRRKAAFLEEVTLPVYLPTQTSMVFLKRPAYHAALQGYLEFHQSPGVFLAEPALERPLENLPHLYQVWGTLEVLAVLLDLTGSLGYKVKSQQLAKREGNNIFIRLLPDGKPVLVLEHPTSGTMVKVIPERTYANINAGDAFYSMSFAQRPDIAIEIFPAQSPSSIYVFDPKYKLDSDRQEEGPGNGTPKKEDIDKMHTYRDAILDAGNQRVVHFAAILYPGSSKSYGNNIEAIQAVPDARRMFEERLKVILTEALRF
jgi:predicted component of viral defense system (DUF524 family)